jgi:hypothetical protein
MSPDGKTHNQIDRVLVDMRRHSNVLAVRSFRAAQCDTDHYLMVAKVRERLAVNKQRSHRFHMERSKCDRLCGLVVRVLGYRSGGPGSIPGTTRFSGKRKENK